MRCTCSTVPRDVTDLSHGLSPQLLARLLKSSHSEDLQAANRLIKSMIKEVGIRKSRQFLWSEAVCGRRG